MKNRPLSRLYLITFLTVTSSFLEVKNALAGSLPENRGKFLLVEVPDGKRNPDLVVVEKENGIKSLIKVNTKENVEKKVEEGTILCSEDQEQAECPKGYYCSKLDKAKNGTCWFNPTGEVATPLLPKSCYQKSCNTHDDCKLYNEQENPLGCEWRLCLRKRCHPLLY